MSARPAPGRPKGQSGVARIFKQSVIQIGIKDGQSSSNMTESKPGAKNDLVKLNDCISNTDQCKGMARGRSIRFKGRKKRGSPRKSVERKVGKENTSSVLSIDTEGKLSHNNKFKGIQNRQTNNNKGDGDSKHVPKKYLPYEAVINHFKEDWSDEVLCEEDFKRSFHQNVELQSTPKKQVGGYKRNDSQTVKAEQNLEGDQLTAPADDDKQSEIFSVVKDSDCNGIALVLSQNDVTIVKELRRKSIDSEQNMMIESHSEDKKAIVRSNNKKDDPFINKRVDLVNILCTEGEYIPPMPEQNESLMDKTLIGIKDCTMNGESSSINNTVSHDKANSTIKPECKPFKNDSPNKRNQEKTRSFQKTDTSNTFCKISPQWRKDIPPRFLKQNHPHHEQNLRDLELPLHNSSKPWKKWFVSSWSAGINNECTSHPKPFYRSRSGLMKNKNGNCKDSGSKNSCYDRDFNNVRNGNSTKENVNVKENPDVSLKFPCPEDWESEICGQLDNMTTDSIHNDQKTFNCDAKGSCHGIAQNLIKHEEIWVENSNHYDKQNSPSGANVSESLMDNGVTVDVNCYTDNKQAGYQEAEYELLIPEPYLPPAPPSNESFTDFVEPDDHIVEAMVNLDSIENNGNDHKTDHGQPRPKSGNGDVDKAKRYFDQDYIGSGTNHADISELPLDEIAYNISSGSDYIAYQNRIAPALGNSQEDCTDQEIWRDVPVGPTYTTQTDQESSQWYDYANYVWEHDHRDWWNGQYDPAYWNSYYYMYMEMCQYAMDMQQFDGQRAALQHLYTPNRDVNKADQSDLSPGKGANCLTRGMENLEESLQSDMITARTTNWVNSHVVDNSSTLRKTQKLTNSRDGQKHFDDIHSSLQTGSSTKERTAHGRNEEEDGLFPCSCNGEDVNYVTWRVCKCGMAPIRTLDSTRERTADLGYNSYESNMAEQEDLTLLRKDVMVNDSSIPKSHYLWNPTSNTPERTDKMSDHGKPFYFDQVYNRNLSSDFQQVYMLHSSERKESQSSDQHMPVTGSQPAAKPVDNKHATDVNGNTLQSSKGTKGKLSTIIDNMNQASRCQSLNKDDKSLFDQAEQLDNQRSRADYMPELSYPLAQYETHMAHVETTLSKAEKTYSQLGRSFSIMKNAISAIEQCTGGLDKPEESGNVLLRKPSESKELDIPLWKRSIHNVESQIVQGTSLNKAVSEGMPGIHPFSIRRREKENWESSSGPLSESSDDICKDSVLSQSPDKHLKKDQEEILPHFLLGDGQERQLKSEWSASNHSPNNMLPILSRNSHNYCGFGVKAPPTSTFPIRYRRPCHYNKETIGNWDAVCNMSVPDKSKSVQSSHFSGQMTPSNRHSLFDKTITGEWSIPPNVTVDKTNITTPSKHTREKHKAKTPIQRRLSQLVDYGNEDGSSSDAEIEPFDVNSLNSDINPDSCTEDDNANQATICQGKPKKLKQDITSDDDSMSAQPTYPKHDQAVKKPATVLKRPQRRLSHKQLKCLPSDDCTAETRVKSTTPQPPRQPQTIAEMISMARQDEYNEKKSMGSPLGQQGSPFSASPRPGLPPLPPFPQSQFWSMYLPKYNSALTGKRESLSPQPQSGTPMNVTPEFNRPKQRRSWGGAACAIASPSDTESETILRNDWRSTFKRFHDFGVKYIDTHCHLDFLFKREGFRGNLRDYMEKSPETFPESFEGCVAVFCNPMTFTPYGGLWKEVAKEDNVWIAMGCHPKMATDFDEAAEAGLQKCLTHTKCVALGEIGLDYSGNFHQHELIQKRVFRRQLTIALEMQKPLVIHCRDAEEDCLEILKEMVPHDYKIHCHCFTGFYYNAKLWLDAFPNLYIGVTPLVTFRSATPSHDLARKIPLNRLLLETDAPYFIPRQIPKDDILFSNPGLAITVAKEIAQFQELPVAAVLRHCRLNTKAMYGI